MKKVSETEKRNARNAKSYRRVLAKYSQLNKIDKLDNSGSSKKMHWYFNSIRDFKEISYNGNILNIIIFYICMRIERAQRIILKCDMIKRHNVNEKTADNVLDKLESRREVFFAKYKVLIKKSYKGVTKKSISEKTKAIGERTRLLRNAIIHGNDAAIKPKRKERAIADLLDYAILLNAEVFEISGFKPFGDLTDFSGSGKKPSNNIKSIKTLKKIKFLKPKKKQQPKCLETCPIK